MIVINFAKNNKWALTIIVVIVGMFSAGYCYPFFPPEVEILSKEVASGITASFGSVFVLCGIERIIF